MNNEFNDNEFKEKQLKLLADPHKLKIKKFVITTEDYFKTQMERKFGYLLNELLYQHILKIIKTELIIDSVIQDVINQVILDHNP
tara:strand:+ start:857 stop:1111 length:255 start_codon:yes stop_codon:yes gene_type:complete